MNINGKILEIMDTQQVSDAFKKRTFIVEYIENPQYPEYISFELIQDRCELIDSFQVDQEVTVSFNLKGRKWVSPAGETKYFTSLQVWRIEAANKEANPNNPNNPPTQESKESGEDELPF